MCDSRPDHARTVQASDLLQTDASRRVAQIDSQAGETKNTNTQKRETGLEPQGDSRIEEEARPRQAASASAATRDANSTPVQGLWASKDVVPCFIKTCGRASEAKTAASKAMNFFNLIRF